MKLKFYPKVVLEHALCRVLVKVFLSSRLNLRGINDKISSLLIYDEMNDQLISGKKM